MSIDRKRMAVNMVIALERSVQARREIGGDTPPPRRSDCVDARNAVEAVRHFLPTVVYSTLLDRIQQVEMWLTQQQR